MLTTAFLLKCLHWTKEVGAPLLSKYWRQLLVLGLVFWVIVCSLTHCGSTRPIPTGGTTVVQVDTMYVYDETWKTVLGDTVAFYEAELKSKVYTAPTISLPDATTADSLKEYTEALKWTAAQLEDCDYRFRSDYRFRLFKDSLDTDSFRLVYEIPTLGRLKSAPKFSVNWKIPTQYIETTTTETIVVEPRRSLYAGLEAGVQMQAVGNEFSAAVIGAELGYMNKTGLQLGVGFNYDTRNRYAVLVNVRRNFYFGK